MNIKYGFLTIIRTVVLFLLLGGTAHAGLAKIAAGDSHTVVIKSDGTLWVWGTDPAQIAPGDTFIDVAAGMGYTVAIKTDGTLWAWGDNSNGQLGDGTTVSRSSPVQILSGYTFKAVAAGRRHTLAIRSDGTLWAWGWNLTGQLGDGTTVDKYSPVQVAPGSTFKTVAAGSLQTMAIKSDGTLWTWGNGASGQLCDGSTGARQSPFQIASGSTFTAVAGGNGHTLAIRTDGTLWACGLNSYGQLGDNTTTQRVSPVQSGAGGLYKTVAAGEHHTIAIRTDGTLWAWGLNEYGQLGNGTAQSSPVPTQIAESGMFTSVDAGVSHSVAIKTDGTLWAWGRNNAGQLGDGTTANKYLPIQIVPTSAFASVVAGNSYAVALRTDGTLWAWGFNGYGQLGDGTSANKSVPVQIMPGSAFTVIAGGGLHTAAIKSDGTLWAWGHNAYGQVGDGTTGDRWSPVQVAPGSTFTAVAAGNGHTLAIKTDGTLWAWGRNAYGELGDGTTLDSWSPVQVAPGSTFTAVAAGNVHTLAIKTDGTLWAWGYNADGQVGDGTTENKSLPAQIAAGRTFNAVAAGTGHTSAIATDGTLWAWGNNTYGQLGTGSQLSAYSPVQIASGSTFIAVEVGLYHTAAIKTDGSLWAWGYNYYGQLGDGSIVRKLSPEQIMSSSAFNTVAAGSYHTLAIKTDGALWAWGDNQYGQLGDGSAWKEMPEFIMALGPFAVTPSAGANGGISPTTTLPVDINSSATFTVTPNAGYSIGSVTGCGGTLVGNTYTTGPITAACTVSATFLPITWSLDVTLTGTGTVHTSPGTDLACTSNCGTSYNEGTVVTLTAEPGQGQMFTGWSGVCSGTGTCQVTMDAAKSVTATFVLVPAHTLHIRLTGSGQVSTYSPSTGYDVCLGICDMTFTEGSVVSLSEAPGQGQMFSGWSGACTGTVGACQITMNTDMNVSATFIALPCAEPFSPSANWQYDGSAVNDLGEVVWSEELQDGSTGKWYSQIMSSTRGQLTTHPVQHWNPSLNNRGDVVWRQEDQNIYGLIGGQLRQLTTSGNAYSPSINDTREIVWSQTNGTYRQIYSNRRGWLTSDPSNHVHPVINNNGDVVYSQKDANGWSQIYYHTASGGVWAYTQNHVDHDSPSIGNSGEIIWREMIDAKWQVFSNFRGFLTSDNCPSSQDLMLPSVNACGDVIFSSLGSGIGQIYRLGNSAPCIADAEPNNSQVAAALITGSKTIMGIVQEPGDAADWYKLSAKADQIVMATLNWGPIASPDDLTMDLLDENGIVVTSASGTAPMVLSSVATYTGDYYVRLTAGPGSLVGYNLAARASRFSACAEPVSSGPLLQQIRPAMNDLGEIVWSELDAQGHSQIHSNMRGQLTSDANFHERPSINNLGDMVWAQQDGNIYGIVSGQLQQLSFTGYASDPSINDKREILWMQWDGSHSQIFSNERGWLTSDPMEHWLPSVNNAGDVVWQQPDESGSHYLISLLSAGSSDPVLVKSNVAFPSSPSISNSGEIVWSEYIPDDYFRIESSVWGQLTFEGCPLEGRVHLNPAVNACGDVAFVVDNGLGMQQVYRLGNNSPCYTPPPASSVTLTPSPASPQPAGTQVNFTANALGGSGQYEYKFYLWDKVQKKWIMQRDYATTASWTWDTTSVAFGTYNILVYVRNAGSIAAYEASTITPYTISTPPASSVTLVASPTSPQPAGTQVTFTATASGGSGQYEYKFYLWDKVQKKWIMQRDYAATASWTWDTTAVASGTYNVLVYVRNAGSTASYEASTITPCTLAPPASSATLTANPASPQPVSTQVTFTATGSGGSGQYEYKFYLWDKVQKKWIMQRDFAVTASWTWDTTTVATGTYNVLVYVRNAGSTASYEASTITPYTLTAPPVSSVTLAASPTSPQAVSTQVTFTATASGGSGQYEYKFYLWDKVQKKWIMQRDYATTSSWTWDTAAIVPGTYNVLVYVRNAGSTASYEASAQISDILQ